MSDNGGVPFARGLRTFGDRLAVVTAGGRTLTYHQLADQVADAAARLGQERRLVMITSSGGQPNDTEPLVVYLAALAAGHPVLLAGPDDDHSRALAEVYRPDVVLAPGAAGTDRWQRREQGDGRRRDLHPDLALLLSTSGSTGSAKLVRLSGSAVQSNAAAIASYLDIRDSDRAPVQLPIHYCYGLSVVNSNLTRGAGLILTEGSVTEERFWSTWRAWDGTSLHGVPYTFDLLARVGFEDMDLPGLRYVTQAGGALAPHRVRELALLGQRRGWRFFAMYGQTEATARMAYLPPELAAGRPEAVGRPIPGGSFEVIPDPDQPSRGQLVYRGPNVMMGYAESAADLAAGATVQALATGDIARRAPDGLYEIVGRASRFVKLFGLRIDLDRAERLLAEHGLRAACVGTDDRLTVLVSAAGTAQAAAVLASRLRLPMTHIQVLAVEELPRRPSGKIDYPAVRALADSRRPADAALPTAGHPASAELTAPDVTAPVPSALRARFARVLGHREVADDATFIELGGDSLTYVRMSLEIERALGQLPPSWPTMPVADLEHLARRRAEHTPGPDRCAGVTRAGTPRTIETNVVLRAVAVVFVVANHIGLFHLLGGAHLLLVLAGWTFARFCLPPDGSGRDAGRATATSRRILAAAARVAIPSMLWLAWRAATTSDVRWSNVMLIDNYLRGGVPGYWFVEVLVQVLAVLAALFVIPAVRRWERRHGFGFALAVLGIALVASLPTDGEGTFPSAFYVTHGAVWFFVLGWLTHRAASAVARVTVLGIAAVTVPGYFDNPTREAVVLIGLAALLFVRRVPLPAAGVAAAGTIASASLYTYLTHYAVYAVALPALDPLPVLLLCLAVGSATAAAAERVRTLPRPRGSAGRAGAAAWHTAAGIAARAARKGPRVVVHPPRAASMLLDARWWAVAPSGLVSAGPQPGPIGLGQPLTLAYGRLNRPG